MEMSFGVDTLITIILGFFSLSAVWTKLNNRLSILETKHDFSDERFGAIDKKFDEVMMHLRRIEDKLDHKADR